MNTTEYPQKTSSRCPSRSPWAGSGMATRDPETVFDRAGVDMIPIEDGNACLSRNYWAQQEHQSDCRSWSSRPQKISEGKHVNLSPSASSN